MTPNRISTRFRRISTGLLIICLSASRALFAASAQTERLNDILESEPDGTSGAYVKEVDGPVLVDIRAHVVFEPASTVKALHLVRALRAVQDGELTLGSEIPWCSKSINTGEPHKGCPYGPCNEWIEVDSALEQMMVDSDNRTTDAVAHYFGVPDLMDTAVELGMNDTALNHVIGCGGPIPNTLTLEDIGSLYEEVATGYLDAAHRATMFDIMLSPSHLEDTIDEEAADLGVDEDAVAYFKAHLGYSYKGGSYDLPGFFGTRFHRTFGGYASLPTVGGDSKEYVFGAFVNEAETEASANRVRDLRPEMLREQIRAALATFLPDESSGPSPADLIGVRLVRVYERPIWWPALPARSVSARTASDDRRTAGKPSKPDPRDGRRRKGRAPGMEESTAASRPVEFVRADANLDGSIDTADVLFLLDVLFGRGGRPACLDAADVNDDGGVDLADPMLLFGHLFGGADLPRGTVRGEYQTDRTPDGIGCASYPPASAG